MYDSLTPELFLSIQTPSLVLKRLLICLTRTQNASPGSLDGPLFQIVLEQRLRISFWACLPLPCSAIRGKTENRPEVLQKRLPSRQPYLHTSIFQLFDNENIVKIEAMLSVHFEIIVKAFLHANLNNSVCSNVLDDE